jgi:hypothetical protein
MAPARGRPPSKTDLKKRIDKSKEKLKRKTTEHTEKGKKNTYIKKSNEHKKTQ